MSPQPSTFIFGGWSPDLANNGAPTTFGPSLGVLPVADCSNIFYANGNYINIPGPVAIAPSVGQPVLSAFTWYDDSEGQEIVFAGLAEGISGLIDGAWSAFPFFNSQSVTATQMKATTRWGAFANTRPMVAKTKMGAVTTTFVPDTAASVDGGFFSVGNTSNSHTFTLHVTVIGSAAPTAWAWSKISGDGTISNPSIESPTITIGANLHAGIACTVTVNGQPVVATPGTYSVRTTS